MRWLLLLVFGLSLGPNGPTIDPNGLTVPDPGEGGGGFDPVG